MEMLPLMPYKNREHAQDEIDFCARMAMGFTVGVFLFLALGIISDAIDTVLLIEPMMWMLVAVICGIGALVSHMHIVAAKQALGIQTEGGKE